MQNKPSGRDVIRILIVDDIPETRDNIKKLLAFEEDEFKVIDSVGTGREAVRVTGEQQPDIVIMDINMPDMDGIQATSEITKAHATAAVIMMSVNTDTDYMRRAMQAGARQFLGKPIDPDELYSTIRAVYRSYEPIRRSARAMQDIPLELRGVQTATAGGGDGEIRAGNVIAVYGPSGGSGATTIATNLASGLMKKGIKVLIVDGDLQFGDVGVFLKVQSQSTLIDLVHKIDDLDTDFFDSVVSTHESGLKVLLGPTRPELADEVDQVPQAIARIIEKIASSYDFIVIDTSRRLDDTLLSIFDISSKIILVVNPTLSSVKNVKFVLDLFDQLSYAPQKAMLVLNRAEDDRARGRVTIPTEVIEKHLKRPFEAKIPVNEPMVLAAVNKGVPVIASRDRTKSPAKELIELAEHVSTVLMGSHAGEEVADGKAPRKAGGLGFLGRGN